MNSPTSAPSAKVVAGTTGGGLAGALSVIALWILSVNGIDPPAAVQAALGVVITCAVGFLCAYLTPHSILDVPATMPVQPSANSVLPDPSKG